MNTSFHSILLSLCFISFCIACGQSKNVHEKEIQSEPPKEQMAPAPAPKPVEKYSGKLDLRIVPVELNNGEKWVSDGVSADNVFKLDSVIGAVDPLATGEAYQKMMSDCSDALNNAYYSSEYEGEAKTQYDNFLRNIVFTSKYMMSADTAERKEAILVMRSHLSTYSEYFE